MRDRIDALFLPFYANRDRWRNDDETGDAAGLPPPSLARSRGLLAALADDVWMKDEVDLVIDGELYDFSRFLSWARYGTTAEHERYDAFTMTLLAGSYYESFLRRHGFEVRAANAVDRRSLERLGREVDPRFVMLSTTLLFDAAEQDLLPLAVAQIRRAWPDAVLVLGGLMLVSFQKNTSPADFHKLLRYYGADVYVVTPQGEVPCLEILRRGSLDALLADPSIPCTYLVAGGKVCDPPAAAEPALGFEDAYVRWSLLPRERLYHTVHTRTARSCAFRCAFCEYPVNQGPLTLMPLESVEKELRELRAAGTVRSLVFTDDTFNVPLPRFKELCRLLARYDFEWYSFFRAQYADAETAALMKAAHCKGVFLGLESLDDRVLRNMNKAATAEAYRRGVDHLQSAGIHLHANFIVGFPGETEESALKIIPFLDATGIELCTVCIWSFIPSTPIAARTAELGIQGLGVEWRHDTMTSRQAQELARHVVETQKFSVHNAVRGECWSEFLLYANGFDADEVRLAVGAFNRHLGRDNTPEEIRAGADFAALREVLLRHEMPSPRNA